MRTARPGAPGPEATVEAEDLAPRDGRDLSSYARAYGKRAARVLKPIEDFARDAVLEFAEGFYSELGHRAEPAAVLQRLAAQEFVQLREKQARHLAMLFSSTLTVCEHFERAKRVGRVHGMVGLSVPAILDAYHTHQRQIFAILPRSGIDARRQEAAAGILMQRLMLDVEAQTIGHYEVDVETSAVGSSLESAIGDARTLTDLLRGSVDLLASLDGIVGCVVLRPDAAGVLQIELAAGVAVQEYLQSMAAGQVPQIRIDAGAPEGQGPTGRAWRSRQIELCDSYRQDPTLGPWRKVGLKLGLRSSASMPLVDDEGNPFAVLVLYSAWPGFFSTPLRKGMLAHVQHVLGKAVLGFEHGATVPVRERQAYQRYLRDGRVQMVYQPIVDLRDGSLQCVEALARLRGEDQRLVAPGAFLPALGRAELLELFRLGLAQVCHDCQTWAKGGLAPAVSLNLPADALAQDVYRDVLFEALARTGLSPERVHLEILESRDPLDGAKCDERIAELRRAGIRIVQDDLGSGHSSLLRMDRIPFDGVKIDQGFVRNAISDPQRALEFIVHLTRLVRGFGIPVTVEGLEDRALIEAVAILGADLGQGYGIAKPMAAESLLAWHKSFTYDVDPTQPRTPLGALAGYLLWDQQRDMLGNWPDWVEFLNQFPCLLNRYIDYQGLGNSDLQRLLEQNLRAAPFGSAHPAFQHSKAELVAWLTRAIRASRAAT